MTSLIVLLMILVVIALLIGYYADRIFKGARPYGLNGDLIAALLTAVGVGLLDWYIVPMVMPGLTRLMVFLSSLAEPTISVFVVLWLMRYFKTR